MMTQDMIDLINNIAEKAKRMSCNNCIYAEKDENEYPCSVCERYNMFEDVEVEE